MVSTDSTTLKPQLKPANLVNYELLTLGDELLMGLTANGHLSFIGQQLARHGAMLRRNVTITDRAEDIAAQFRESWARADVIITTGGLGPTCDDRTREVIAEVLGQKLVFEPAIEQAINERFARLGRKTPANNRKQAFRFEQCEVLPNTNGTAPGLWVEQGPRVLCMLPGPPNELQPMFTEQVLPRLFERGLLSRREAYVQVRTVGIGESALEQKLQPVFDQYPEGLQIAFCAHTGQVDVRLSSPEGKLSGATLQQIAAECAVVTGDDFLCFGHDTLTKICTDMLRLSDSTLALAETATGGQISDTFTAVHGASKCFAGGCVCYSNESRTQLLDIPEEIMLQHGAVSAETAVAMATGAAERLGADYALSTTGFSGPCTGHKENPVGAVYVGLYTPNGVWARKISYPGPRSTIKQRAVNAALDWLRRELQRGSCSSTPAKAFG
jgi:nicotinamide-nucleotide amidase